MKRLSEQERHDIEHVRYAVNAANQDAPTVCFDYSLMQNLLKVIERAYEQKAWEG